jgi:hypothetical protein
MDYLTLRITDKDLKTIHSNKLANNFDKLFKPILIIAACFVIE